MFEPALIDSHAHLGDQWFKEDLNSVLERAQSANVEHIVNINDLVDPEAEIRETLFEKSWISHTAGIHPHFAHAVTSSAIETLKTFIKHHNIVALGETGLDLYRGGRSPLNEQIRVLNAHLNLALECNLPVILHCRDAYSRMFELLFKKPYKDIRGVVHCFSGDIADAMTLIEAGFFIGIDAPITYPNAHPLREVVSRLPIERLLIETDSPYLPPQRYRGKRNEPAYVRYVAEKIAEIKHLSVKDVMRVTRWNAIRLLALPLDTPPEIAYELRDNLYLNITNVCPNRCWFCQRQFNWVVKGHNLKLDKEPSLDDIVSDLPDDLSGYPEIVFCGLGEPTVRLDLINTLVPLLRQRGAKRLRLDTNGLGNLINGRNIIEELGALFNAISISLNAASDEEYIRICVPEYANAFENVLEFITLASSAFNEVTVSAVDIPGVDLDEIERYVRDHLGVTFRRRAFIDPAW